MKSIELGEHIAVVEPDDRRRVALGRFLYRGPVTGYRLYRLNDGKTIVLEAIE